MNSIEQSFSSLHLVLSSIQADDKFLGHVEKAVLEISKCFQNGGKLLVCGNGGSAADAQHLASEFVGRYWKMDRKGYPALALNAETSSLTAIGNDFGFQNIFSRQVEALGSKGDLLIVFSTSGNSLNLITAVKTAHKAGLKSIAFTGKNGKLKELANLSLAVPSSDTPRIQEIHGLLIHTIVEEVEKSFK